MSRGPNTLRALTGVLCFFAFWLAGHLFDGSAALDARELFNATSGLLAAATMHVLLEGERATFARWALRVALGLAPLVLAFAQAQSFGTHVGVARAAQWLAFACLGQGLGVLGARGPPARRPAPVALGLAFALAALGLGLWAQRGLPQWAPVGAALAFAGVGLALLSPHLGPARRQALALHGLLTPLALALTLFFVQLGDPASGKLFFVGLAFVASWAEASVGGPGPGDAGDAA